MANTIFQIHPQLAADSHALFEWQTCHVRLHNNATFPWLIIVPETEQIEFHDLPTKLQLAITHISQVSSEWFKAAYNCEKTNFAAIGNVVQQLHVHVIGRHSKDPLWPDVVWGNDFPIKNYQTAEIERIKQKLQNLLGVAS